MKYDLHIPHHHGHNIVFLPNNLMQEILLKLKLKKFCLYTRTTFTHFIVTEISCCEMSHLSLNKNVNSNISETPFST